MTEAVDDRRERIGAIPTTALADATYRQLSIARDALAPPADTEKSLVSPWANKLVARLLVVDVICVFTAIGIGLLLRRPFNQHNGYFPFAAALSIAWLICLQTHGGYDVRRMTDGMAEYRRVIRAGVVLAGGLAVLCFLTGILAGRMFVGIVIPIGTVGMIAARFFVRQSLHRRRRSGDWISSVLAVGNPEAVANLAATVARKPHVGLRVVGACVQELREGHEVVPGVPVLGNFESAATVAERLDVDVVAVAGSGLGPRRIRELGWALEGTKRYMVMAPSLTGVAGPRVHVSPVDGLPLMWVDQPQFTGLSRLVKRVVDILGASIGLLLLAPVFLALCAANRLTSRGPAFYVSTRVGKGGREFRFMKFRSMIVDADERRKALQELNVHGDGVLFKIRQDPRVTRVGQILRKYSLDELPQLINVLNGSMSLVGPRPPLPEEVERYAPDASRRMLVKPGMTGLWQISGRSDLSWDESVRLDLYYVENWSLAMDLSIIARTIWAVATSRGAY